jgi:hypothetical protein
MFPRSAFGHNSQRHDLSVLRSGFFQLCTTCGQSGERRLTEVAHVSGLGGEKNRLNETLGMVDPSGEHTNRSWLVGQGYRRTEFVNVVLDGNYREQLTRLSGLSRELHGIAHV